MKYYTICFKKAKVHQKDRDSLDLLKNCSENFTDVIDNKKYSGADFIKDDYHHVIQLNKLKYKQNSQIKRLLESIDQYFKGHDHLNDTTKTPNSQGSSFLSSKFLSNGPISGNKNLQRQSVVTTLLDKPQFIKILHSKLFHRTSLEEFMKKTDKDQSEHKVSREEFKQNKGKRKEYRYHPGIQMKTNKKAVLNSGKNMIPSREFTTNEERKSLRPFRREGIKHKNSLLSKEKGKNIISSRSNRKYKGSF